MEFHIYLTDDGIIAKGHHGGDDYSTALSSLLAVARFYNLDDSDIEIFKHFFRVAKNIGVEQTTSIDETFLRLLKERGEKNENYDEGSID